MAMALFCLDPITSSAQVDAFNAAEILIHS
jgi:hypothetical protein